ncbi:MAG: CDP-alcohol phosphatidyltransferase family protein [Oscillospiraceae bacterium]|nr:CDP-alcohol phosphatidyltransferase family protein [Oscillospiraceae bacterium]
MANIITEIRIVVSVALLFFPALSPAFFVLYIAGGISDMIDGAVARRTGTVSEFGSRLDTFADIVFAAVCLIKLLPVLDVPVWHYVWVAVIAIIKFSSITAGYIRQKKFVSVHSVLNKAAGLLLFVFPLTLAFIDLQYSAAVVCMAATAAAVQEGFTIWVRSGRQNTSRETVYAGKAYR